MADLRGWPRVLRVRVVAGVVPGEPVDILTAWAGVLIAWDWLTVRPVDWRS